MSLEWIPETPVTSKILQLHIQEVGPYSGNAFGGIEAIQVFGCVASRNVQRRPSGWSNINPPPDPQSPPQPTYSPYTPLSPVTMRTPEGKEIFSQKETLDQGPLEGDCMAVGHFGQ